MEFGQVVPSLKPYSQASSAVLPRLGQDAGRDPTLVCLDIVLLSTIEPPGEFAWVAISEAATYTYGHTIGLNRGERWKFVRWIDGGPVSFEATYADLLPPSQIERLYGPVANASARKDRDAVQLNLVRI